MYVLLCFHTAVCIYICYTSCRICYIYINTTMNVNVTILIHTLNAKSIHYNDVIMTTMASQITSLTVVYSTVYSDADQRKHQSSASMAFVWGIHWWPMNSPHKGPVMWKMFPFDDVIMYYKCYDEVVLDKCSKSRWLNNISPLLFALCLLAKYRLNHWWLVVYILMRYYPLVASNISGIFIAV